MKIKTVIRAFKKILPIYEKYYNLEITDINEYYGLLSKENILYGICHTCKHQGVNAQLWHVCPTIGNILLGELNTRK